MIFLVGTFFLTVGSLSFYWGVFFNIRFEKDRIIYNWIFFKKPTYKKDIIGYYFSNKKVGLGKYLILLKNDKKNIIFDLNSLAANGDKLKKEVVKNFRLLNKKERKKCSFNIDEYQHWLRKYFGLWIAIQGFLFLIIAIFVANFKVMLLSSIFIIFGGIIYRYFGKKIQTIDI